MSIERELEAIHETLKELRREIARELPRIAEKLRAGPTRLERKNLRDSAREAKQRDAEYRRLQSARKRKPLLKK